MEVARWKGSNDGNAYAWQLRVPDPIRLLGRIAPVLERRLAASSLSGITGTLRIDLYRTSIDLRFEAGRLVVGAHEATDPFSIIRMPPPLLAPLVMGYRTFDELARVSHDVSAGGPGGSLAGVLFPMMQSFLYTTY